MTYLLFCFGFLVYNFNRYVNNYGAMIIRTRKSINKMGIRVLGMYYEAVTSLKLWELFYSSQSPDGHTIDCF